MAILVLGGKCIKFSPCRKTACCAFLFLAPKSFKDLTKIKAQNKNKNKGLVNLPRPLHPYHFQPIRSWCYGTFNALTTVPSRMLYLSVNFLVAADANRCFSKINILCKNSRWAPCQQLTGYHFFHCLLGQLFWLLFQARQQLCNHVS